MQQLRLSENVVVDAIGEQGSGDGQLGRPWGLALVAGGGGASGSRNEDRLFVADSRNQRICVFGVSPLRFLSSLVNGGPDTFMQPTSLAVHDGCLYVADSSRLTIEVMTLGGEFLRSFPHGDVGGWGRFGGYGGYARAKPAGKKATARELSESTLKRILQEKEEAKLRETDHVRLMAAHNLNLQRAAEDERKLEEKHGSKEALAKWRVENSAQVAADLMASRAKAVATAKDKVIVDEMVQLQAELATFPPLDMKAARTDLTALEVGKTMVKRALEHPIRTRRRPRHAATCHLCLGRCHTQRRPTLGLGTSSGGLFL